MKKIIIIAAMIASVLPVLAQQNFKLPKYTTFKLSNGLTVYLMEQKEVPVISVTMTVPAATIYDGTQAGLSQLTASSIDAGSKNYSKEQIREQLDFAGASLYTNSNQEFTRVSAKFATATQDKIFALLKDVVVNPLFDNAEFEKLKTRTRASLERDRQSPQS
ncbi:MAG: insulinase family protein, partial [Chitinophagaceae bacterium]